MKNIVFVQSASGVFVQHGPMRRSEAQATAVARTLARRLGWVAVAAASCPDKAKPGPGAPSLALAGLSPVWKDAGLAAKWAEGGRAPVAPPAPVVAKTKRVRAPKVAAPVAVEIAPLA